MDKLSKDLRKVLEVADESTDYVIIMRRQDREGNEEILPYTSARLSPAVAAGMLQLAQFQILNGAFRPN